MPQSILTRYIPETATKPARVKAWGSGGAPALYVPYHTDTCEGGYWAHRRAAETLVRKLKWSGHWYAQELATGWVFSFYCLHLARFTQDKFTKACQQSANAAGGFRG